MRVNVREPCFLVEAKATCISTVILNIVPAIVYNHVQKRKVAHKVAILSKMVLNG